MVWKRIEAISRHSKFNRQGRVRVVRNRVLKKSNNEIVQLFFKRPYGNNFTNESKVADITGIDILITITFPPKSILLEIAFSPLSLQILTAYSVKIDIPVIFNKREINSVFVF